MAFEHYVRSGQKQLRCGYTTGTCAALAAQGAAALLLTGTAPEALCLTTPKGWEVRVAPAFCRMEGERAVCAVRKDAGGDVALLNLGDVTVYSSFGRIQGELVAAGYRVEMIPGVTSFCAAAARLGRPLTGGMEEPLCIVPGRAGSDLLRAPGAKAFLKSGRDLPRLLEDLAQAGLLSRSALVARCGLPGEEVYPDLSRAQPQGDPDYFTTVLVKGEEE